MIPTKSSLNGWLAITGNPFMAIKYDTLWDNQKRLSEFLDLNIELPERRPRSSKNAIDEEIIEKLRLTYAELDRHISDLPAFIMRPASADLTKT